MLDTDHWKSRMGRIFSALEVLGTEHGTFCRQNILLLTKAAFEIPKGCLCFQNCTLDFSFIAIKWLLNSQTTGYMGDFMIQILLEVSHWIMATALQKDGKERGEESSTFSTAQCINNVLFLPQALLLLVFSPTADSGLETIAMLMAKTARGNPPVVLTPTPSQ